MKALIAMPGTSTEARGMVAGCLMIVMNLKASKQEPERPRADARPSRERGSRRPGKETFREAGQ